jgi:hypothetical protein
VEANIEVCGATHVDPFVGQEQEVDEGTFKEISMSQGFRLVQ